jgi:hypothetical protein
MTPLKYRIRHEGDSNMNLNQRINDAALVHDKFQKLLTLVIGLLDR